MSVGGGFQRNAGNWTYGSRVTAGEVNGYCTSDGLAIEKLEDCQRYPVGRVNITYDGRLGENRVVRDVIQCSLRIYSEACTNH